MARRRDILEAVFNGVSDHVDDTFTVVYDDGSSTDITLGPDDVLRYDPDRLEQTPAVFIDVDQSRPVRYNGIGTQPDYIEYASDGGVEYVEWSEYVEQDIFITVRADHRADEETLYSELRRWIGRYDDGDKRPTDLHPHVNDVTVDSTMPADSTDLDDAIWGDQIQVFVEYAQSYIIESGGEMTMDEAVDTIETISQVNLTVDADVNLDDGDGFDYTIT